MSRKRFSALEPPVQLTVQGASVVQVVRARGATAEAQEECHPQAKVCMQIGRAHV